MLLGINQVVSSGINKFEIKRDNQVIYRAETPWKPIHLKKFQLMNPNGDIYSKYATSQNLASQFMPYKYLFTGEQEFERYGIVNTTGDEVGAFFVEKNGLPDAKRKFTRPLIVWKP